MCFHKRGGPRHDRNRIHFDIEAIDRAGEVARLMSLGATFLRETEQYTVLCDPEGNQFCVVSAQKN
jgi:hypothetical protein